MQTADMRERMFTLRMSEEETARLDRVARHYGLNAAGVVRMLLKREDDALNAAPAQSKPTEKKPRKGK